MTTRRPLAALAAFLLLALSASALVMQAREKIPDHEFERETVVDDEGLKQWAPYDVTCPQCKAVGEIECPLCKDRDMPNCPECGGDDRAVCRICAGAKRLPDPMVEIICPYCRGAGIYPCYQCWGRGEFGVSAADGSSRTEPCRGCDEKGYWECLPCEGTRLVQTVEVGRDTLPEADLDDTKELREELQELLTKNEEFEHDERHRKTAKLLEQFWKRPARKTFPVLDPVMELFEEVRKGFRLSASGYEGFEGRLTHLFYTFQDRVTWHLRHQILVLDKEIERKEHNQQVLEEK